MILLQINMNVNYKKCFYIHGFKNGLNADNEKVVFFRKRKAIKTVKYRKTVRLLGYIVFFYFRI